MKLLLEIAYNGRAFCGYQTQKTERTVQKTLQTALENLFGVPLSVSGCSRTDSGVHAKQFFCTVEGNIPPGLPPDKLPLVALAVLPDDLVLRSAKEVSDAFHVRYDVKSKTYEYTVLNTSLPDPMLAGQVYWYRRPLDALALERAAQAFVGRHNFASFMAAGSKITDPVREIYDFKVRREGAFVIFSVTGNGFLYHMVRILCGTLLSVAEGKIAPEALPALIAAKDRKQAGPTLPPDGLSLVRVTY